MAVDDLARELGLIADQPLGTATTPFTFQPSTGLQKLQAPVGTPPGTPSEGLTLARREVESSLKPLGVAGLDTMAEAESLAKERDRIDKQLLAMADTLAFSGELEERGQQLEEFSKLSTLKLDNLQREIGIKETALNAGLDRFRLSNRIEQQDIRNALQLQKLRNDAGIENLRLDLQKEINEKRLSIDQGMIQIARQSVRNAEQSIRIENELQQGILETGDQRALAALLSGIGQATFAGAGLTLNLASASARGS